MFIFDDSVQDCSSMGSNFKIKSLISKYICRKLLIALSSTSSKQNVLKAFFNITFYCKQGCKLPKYVVKESKSVILYEVFETVWTRFCTCQMVKLRLWKEFLTITKITGDLFF